MAEGTETEDGEGAPIQDVLLVAALLVLLGLSGATLLGGGEESAARTFENPEGDATVTIETERSGLFTEKVRVRVMPN